MRHVACGIGTCLSAANTKANSAMSPPGFLGVVSSAFVLLCLGGGWRPVPFAAGLFLWLSPLPDDERRPAAAEMRPPAVLGVCVGVVVLVGVAVGVCVLALVLIGVFVCLCGWCGFVWVCLCPCGCVGVLSR